MKKVDINDIDMEADLNKKCLNDVVEKQRKLTIIWKKFYENSIVALYLFSVLSVISLISLISRDLNYIDIIIFSLLGLDVILYFVSKKWYMVNYGAFIFGYSFLDPNDPDH
jgi:hypothetical protein